MTGNAPPRKYCMICGVRAAEDGSMCTRCKDQLRREAMGDKKQEKAGADQALRKHGVTPKK